MTPTRLRLGGGFLLSSDSCALSRRLRSSTSPRYDRASNMVKFSAGGTRPTLELSSSGELSQLQSWQCPGINWAVYQSFAPGGAQLSRRGNTVAVHCAELGEGRIALLIKAWRFRQVKGHTPKVWQESTSACTGGLLILAAPGCQVEIAAYKRQFRRFRVASRGLVEIDQSTITID